MVTKVPKFNRKIEKMKKLFYKYSKIDDKIAATLIFAATLIIAPMVVTVI
jgi:hypothetical protein